MRAADGGDSARFMSSFLALSFFYISNRFHARPLSAANASRWAHSFFVKSWGFLSRNDLYSVLHFGFCLVENIHSSSDAYHSVMFSSLAKP
jgi:hypothetical protein